MCCKTGKNRDASTAILGLFEAVLSASEHMLSADVSGVANSTLLPLICTSNLVDIAPEILSFIPG
jgi:hypothetical protein